MDETKIEDLIKENQAYTTRTPYLDVSLGGLRTALENLKQHKAQEQAKAGPQKK
jgi:hypothetical protein